MEEEQLTIFGDEELEKNNLSIVHASYISNSSGNIDDLFDGYDTLKAITYSSDCNFIFKVKKKINDMEIVFGSKNVINNQVADLLAYQNSIQQAIIRSSKKKGNKRVLKAIENGSLRLYTLNEMVSHVKVFILRDNDTGNTRIVTGSANLSSRGFGGIQLENIIVFDNDNKAYDYYMELFEKLVEESSSRINYDKIVKYIETVDVEIIPPSDLPVFEYIQQEKTFIIDNQATFIDEELDNMDEIREVYKQMLPENLTRQKKEVIIDFPTIKKVDNNFQKFQKKKERKSKYLSPELIIDYDSNCLYQNGVLLERKYDLDLIKDDIDTLFVYLDTLKEFTGDIPFNQQNYYKLFVWSMVSPFMPYLRYLADKYHEVLDPGFPLYAAVYGESDGGKTTFFKLISKLISGEDIEFSEHTWFTPTKIIGLRQNNKGVPLFFDDISNTQMNKFESIVKRNDMDYSSINYPCVLISTNKDVTSMKDYISKRCYTCFINAKIQKTKGPKIGKSLNNRLSKASNNFFIEFAYRMFDGIDEIKECISDEEYNTDVFKLASNILMDIIKEVYPDLDRKYVVKLNKEDYFGEEAIGKNAVLLFTDLYRYDPSAFKIEKKKNKLIYTIPENDYTVNRIIKTITDEMPLAIHAKRSGRSLIMELKETEKFIGMKIRKENVFSKFMK